MTTTPTPQPDRAILYIRESDPRKHHMLASQQVAVRDYARAHNYRIAADLTDLESGDVLWERPQLTALRAIVRAGEAEVVVLNDSSRLTRNFRHRIVLREEFLHYGCRVEYVVGQPDDSEEGALLEMIHGYAHKIGRDKIIEGAIRGRHHRAKQLRILPGGPPLYGYDWGDPLPKLDEHGQPMSKDGKPLLDEHATYRPRPSTSQIVVRIFEEVAAGLSPKEVAKGLNYDHILPPTDRSKNGWNVATITQMIEDASYKGKKQQWVKHAKYEEHGKQRGTHITKRVRHLLSGAKDDTERGNPITLPEAVCPRLVSDALWEAANHQRELAREGHGTGGVRGYDNSPHDPTEWLLVGHVKCGVCKNRMQRQAHRNPGAPNGAYDLRYRCSTGGSRPGVGCARGHSMRADWLDAYVWERVFAQLERPDDLTKLAQTLAQTASAAHQHADNTDANLVAVLSALATLDKQIATARQAIALLEAAPGGTELARPTREQLALLQQQRAELDADRIAIAPKPPQAARTRTPQRSRRRSGRRSRRT